MALKTVPFNVAFTFSRPNPADYEDINGDTQTAGTDVPRFNYSEGVGEGLMLDASLSEIAVINDVPGFNSTEGTWVLSGAFNDSAPLPGSGFIEPLQGDGFLVFVYKDGVGRCWSDGEILYSDESFTAAEPSHLTQGGLCKIKTAIYYPYAWSDEKAAEKSSGAFSLSYSPTALFDSSQEGIILDISDTSSLFQDYAKTVPVTADGEPVKLVEDKSGNGYDASIYGTGDVLYRTDGFLHWLEFAGTQWATTSPIAFTDSPEMSAFSASEFSGSSMIFETSADASSNTGAFFQFLFSGFYRHGANVDGTIRQLDTAVVAQANNVVATKASAITGEMSTEVEGDTYSRALPASGAFKTFPLNIASRNEGGSFKATGKFYGLIIANQIYSSALHELTKNYLKRKSRRDPPLNADVFIVAGQSNSVDRAAFDDGADWPSNVWQLGRDGANDGVVIPAVRPLDHWNKPQAGGFGWSLQFALDYAAANPSREIVIIPAGEGGTSFQAGEWTPTGLNYTDLISRANTLFSEYPGYSLKGILWHQGESDGGNASYESDLDTGLSGFRSDIAVASSSTPIVVGQLAPEYVGTNPGKQAIQDIITDTPNRLPNVGVALSATLTTSDGTHFDAASMRVLGTRYHDELELLS